MNPDELARIVEQAASRYGVPPNALMAIANLESSGRVDAKNPRSSASGLFQFVDSTANEYGLTGNKRNDPVAQADAAARMMATNARSLERTLGRPADAGELYLAHQQGLTGATALLQNPNRPAVDVLTGVYGSRQKAENAIRLNAGNANQSAAQFANQWVNKANQRASLVPPGSVPNVVASRLDTQRPPDIQGRNETPTSAISRAFPTRDATPRLAPAMDGVFAYTPPGLSSAQIAPGMGSLTPEFFNRDVPMPRPRPSNAVTGFPTPRPSSEPGMPQRLPELAPPPMSGQQVITASMQRAAAAQDPALAAALNRRAPANLVDQSIANAQAANNPQLQAALALRGQSMNPLSRDSTARAAMGMGAGFPAPSIPGPAGIAKSQERLTPGVLPMAPTGPQVASALSVTPNVPMPRPRPSIAPRQAVQGFPTPMAMRPMSQPRGLASIAMPTPVAQRPSQAMTNAPLRIVVNGGSGGSSGSMSGPSSAPRGILPSGQIVTQQQSQWYNPDTNAFEKRTVWR